MNYINSNTFYNWQIYLINLFVKLNYISVIFDKKESVIWVFFCIFVLSKNKEKENRYKP